MISPKTSRILTLDVCRGFMLFMMTFNHLMLFPFIGAAALHKWTMNAAYGKFGFISNSEGFFFIAGITAGIVYGRLTLQGKEHEIWPRIKKRLKQMYGIYAAFLIVVALFVFFHHKYYENWKDLHRLLWDWVDQPGIHYFLDNPLKGLGMGLAFLYQLPLLDLFIIYIFFIALIPCLLNLLKNGKANYLIAASVFCYVASQYDPGLLEQALLTFLPVKLAWFHLGAIQILFTMGLVLGFLYVKGCLPSIHKVFIATVAVLIGIAGWLYLTGVDIQNAPHLGLLRLGLFSLKAYAVFLVRHQITFKPLALLGKHSLSIFIYHIALTFFLIFFLAEISALPPSLKLALLAVSISTIWIPAYMKESKKLIVKKAAQ